MKARWLLPFIVALLTVPAPADARPVVFPPYQHLLDKSDLVVVATPVAAADTKERIDLPGISVASADGTSSGLPVIGVETKFRVLAVLKGKSDSKTFILHHYRKVDVAETSPNDVMLVTFDPAEPGSFLLFLVREQDGRYAPFNQTDPGMIAVQKLVTNTADDTNKPTGL